MGYYDLLQSQAPVLMAPLDDASGVPVNRGSNASAITDIRVPVTYRSASSPVGKAMGFGVGHFTSDLGMVAGKVAHTIGAWIRTTSTDSVRSYAGNPANCIAGDWSNAVLRGFGVHNGKVEYTRFTTNAVWLPTIGNISVNDGGWHLIAAACTGATGVITIVVDGVQDVQVSINTEWNTGGSFCTYGGGYDTGVRTIAADWFQGDVAGLFITPTTMTVAELLALYRAGIRESVVTG